MSNPKVINLQSDDFEETVIKSEIPVVVDFWAEWCSPCRMLAPIIDQIADDLDGKAKICKLNIDDNGAIAASFGVMSIPTLLVFKDGQPVERIVGSRPKEQLLPMIERFL